jgi:hypothetical protein
MIIHDAVKLYNEGLSLGEIAKISAVSKASVYRFLKGKVDFKPFRNPTYKDRDIHHFLDNIDTEEKAYFLGFAYADGSVHKCKDVLVFNLHQQDIAVLEKFSLLLLNQNMVRIQNRNRDGKIYKHCILELCSKSFKQKLIELGCPPTKTFVLTFPQWLISPELRQHFIRGYFDGDGCFSVSGTHTRVQLTSTRSFLEGVQKVLAQQNITSQIYQRGKICDLVISSKDGSITFLNWIYKNSSIFLDRKYDKYIKFIS